MIIRLIDIVLIVLFGFIVISDIDIKGTLPLPARKKEQTVERKVPVSVEIDDQDSFWVSLQGQGRRRLAAVTSLENYLRQLKSAMAGRGEVMAVIILPHEDSTVQATIDVLDVCKRNGIPRNIARRSLAL